MKRNIFYIFAVMLVILTAGQAIAQDADAVEEKKEQYQFTMLEEIPHTSMKNQGSTGTCWCFATVSFIESEALRLGAPELDLSEMFIVRLTYPRKADNYMRLHGKANFSQGALSNCMIDQLAMSGIVPESVYSGLTLGQENHSHGEMVRVMTGVVDGVIKSRKPSIRWKEAFDKVADVYLGEVPESFEYEGKTYTPKEFAEEVVKVNPKDYIELTSFKHLPFYEQVRLDVPDNWNYNDDFYNIPLDELEAVADYALENGYSVCWDGDVSERSFAASKDGYAIVPKENAENDGENPVEEMKVCQCARQKKFDDFSTTDDHLMHIVGLSRDQNGAKYYYFKNSWGSRGKLEGYFHMSKPYYRLKTTAIMVHKDAVPAELREKLGFLESTSSYSFINKHLRAGRLLLIRSLIVKRSSMNVIIDLCVIPMGVGVSVSKYVAACEEILSAAGLTTRLHAYGTNVEGEWDEVFRAVKACHEKLHQMGAPRISTTMRVGTRTDREQSGEEKIESVLNLMKE